MKENLPIELKESPHINKILNYYYVEFHCENCSKMSHRYILKGHKIKSLVSIPCDNCGCQIKTY